MHIKLPWLVHMFQLICTKNIDYLYLLDKIYIYIYIYSKNAIRDLIVCGFE